MTGKQAGIKLCAVPFFRRAFQVYDTLNTTVQADGARPPSGSVCRRTTRREIFLRRPRAAPRRRAPGPPAPAAAPRHCQRPARAAAVGAVAARGGSTAPPDRRRGSGDGILRRPAHRRAAWLVSTRGGDGAVGVVVASDRLGAVAECLVLCRRRRDGNGRRCPPTAGGSVSGGRWACAARRAPPVRRVPRAGAWRASPVVVDAGAAVGAPDAAAAWAARGRPRTRTPAPRGGSGVAALCGDGAGRRGWPASYMSRRPRGGMGRRRAVR